MKRKQSPRFWIFFVLVLALMPMVVSKVGDSIEKARESEARTMLNSAATAQKAFFKEHQAYGEDLSKIGYSPEGLIRCKLFLKKEDIPAADLSLWPEECLPYVTKETFKVSCLMKNGKKIRCFSLDEKDVFNKMEVAREKN